MLFQCSYLKSMNNRYLDSVAWYAFFKRYQILSTSKLCRQNFARTHLLWFIMITVANTTIQIFVHSVSQLCVKKFRAHDHCIVNNVHHIQVTQKLSCDQPNISRCKLKLAYFIFLLFSTLLCKK